jgi:hypothetical protein
MNTLLAITADFFEHLTNPAFGRETNDDYDFKFHVLMHNDAEAAQQLATAPLGRDDVGSMSTAAWLWYLTWRESVTDERTSSDFLDALYDETANPILRLRIVEIGIRDMQSDQARDDTIAVAGLENMRRTWVRDRIRNVVGEGDLGPQGADLQQTRIEEAWELLSYLIEVGSDASLDAARVLLTERWPGTEALRQRALELVTQMQLIDEASLVLRARLGLQQ